MNIIRFVSAVAVLSVVGAVSADTIWVSKATGDDDYAGEDIGSEEHPFATIQAGVDKAQSGDTVKVLEGEYATGETFAGSCTSRVAIINKKIHLVAPDGAAKTTIVGKWSSTDPTGATKTNTDNIRCVYVEASNKAQHGTVIEGFTFKDGAAFVEYGGGVASKGNIGTYVVDCIFTNCTGCGIFDNSGPVLPVADYVNIVRCRFRDCTGWAMVRYGKAFACLFEDCQYTRGVFGYSDSANCTIVGCGGSTTKRGGNLLFNNPKNGGKFYNNLSTLTTVSTTFNNSDAASKGGCVCLVDGSDGGICFDAANGDYRLMPDSPALGISDAAMVTNVLDFGLGIVAVSRKDLSGVELPLEGVINAGAYQEVRTRVSVAEFPYGGAVLTGVGAGEVAWVDEDLEVAISSAPASGTRLCLGVTTNGVRVLFANEPDGIRFTVTRGSASIAVEPIYSTHWYVDASRPNDDGDGFTPQTAKKTLADACTNMVLLAGDTIHVAAGVYDTGVCAPSEGHVIGARAAVPAGVTLLADGSVDETIIEGAEATEPNRDLTDARAVYHTGTDAVRCVLLNANSTVRGFTLRNGVTRGDNSATGAGTSNPDFCGGGVSGPHAAGAGWHLHVVENCVISNCVAAWGGAADGVRLVGCRLIDNFATRYGRHSNYCSEEGSCFSGLSGLPNATVSYITFYPQRMLNSTYCANGSDGGFNNDVATPPTNCVFLGKLTTSEKSDVSRRSEHCIFIRYTTEVVKPENILTDTCLFLDNAAAFGLDADFRPASTNSPVVDFCATIPDRLSALDPAGVQRVYNGRIDCGAYEYDWRGEYAKALLPRGKCLSVAVADGCVQEVDGKVCQPAGKLVLRFTSDKVDPDDLLATVSVRVPDDGTLTVTSGETAIVPTAGADAGLWDYPIRKTATQFDVTFEYAGEGYVEFQGVQKAAGLILIFR